MLWAKAQVGKTTLAKNLKAEAFDFAYLDMEKQYM